MFGFGVGIQRLGSIAVNSLSDLNALATPATGLRPTGIVMNDADPTKNGMYTWNGTVWAKARPLPDQVAKLTVSGGTANAITATAQAGVDPAVTIISTIIPTATNTGNVTINGKPVLTRSGAQIAPGAFASGVLYVLLNNATDYRVMLSDFAEIADIVGLQAALDAKATASALSAEIAARSAADDLKANSADVYTKTQMDALLAASWSFIPIGMKVPLSDNLTGVVAPPTDQAYRFIKLTAGLTGVGAYNNGVLGSESVSGTAPLVQATAVITLASSPLNGQTIRLINTERRFLRAYDTSGTVMDDALQGHKHNSAGNRIGTTFNSGSSNLKGWNSENGPDPTDPTSGPVSDGTNGTPRTANETRGKFIGETYFMRIK